MRPAMLCYAFKTQMKEMNVRHGHNIVHNPTVPLSCAYDFVNHPGLAVCFFFHRKDLFR